MKKVILMMATVFSVAFFSCKKEKISEPLKKTTLIKNPTFPDQNIISGLSARSGEYIYTTPGGVNYFSARMEVYMGGTLGVSNIVNMYFEIRKALDTNIVVYQSSLNTQVLAINGYGFVPLASGDSYLYRIYIKTKAGSVGTLQTTISLEPQWNNIMHGAVSATGQVITVGTVPSSSLETSVSTSNPAVQKTTGSQEVVALSNDFLSTGGTNTVTELVYKLVDVNTMPSITSLKLYDGSTVIGTANFTGGSANFLLSMPVSSVKTLIVKLVVGGITEVTSGLNFKLVLDRVKYTDAGGVLKVNEKDREGNDIFIKKSILIVSQLSVPTLQIVNGQPTTFYSHKEESVGGPSARKQHTYEIILNDQGVNDTLTLKKFKVYEGGVDVTSHYRFTKGNGVIDTVLNESDNKIFCTRISGTGETIISSSLIVSFEAVPNGFNHPLDGDGIKVTLLGDTNTPPSNFKNLNTGGVVGSARLFSSNTPSSSAPLHNYIVSDISASPHNGQFGTSTKDWSALSFTLGSNFFHQ